MASLISHRIAWDFDAHKADGKLGGDDFLTHIGERVEAPVSGRLTMSNTTAVIRQADGWRTVLLELGGLVGAQSRDVVKGETIATAGLMFVHAHDLAPGAPSSQHTRSRWVTAALTTAGGNGTPITAEPAVTKRRKEDSMFVHGVGAPTVAYEGFTDANGAFRLRPCSENQSAIVIGSGQSDLINDDRLTRLGIEAGWVNGKIPSLRPAVTALIDHVALAAALAPLLDGDTDEDALAEKLAMALAPQFTAVNVNINDQPTHFTIDPA